MKRIVVCDDNNTHRDLLKDMLAIYFSEIQEPIDIREYESGDALVAEAKEEYLKMDLLFLDIHMEGIDGIETARQLRRIGWRIPIIFLTESPEYAVESYEVQAAGYLVKPYSEEQLKETLERIFKIHLKRRIPIKSKRQQRYPYVDDIIYIESDKHQVTVHLVDGSEIRTTEKLGDMEAKIRDPRFLRCNQSYLVNMDYIADVEEDFILSDQTRIPIRVRGRKEMLDTYNAYFMEKFSRQNGVTEE